MLSIDGLATGLDTTAIIDRLVAIQNRQIDELTNRQKTIAAEQAAFKGIEASLLDLRAQLGQLARSQNSVFQARSANSSDPTALVATAKSAAALGVYSLKINSLAQAHQIASQGFESADAAITQGTFSVQVGNGPVTTVTVDSTNNTLQGLADAINTAGGDVSASIINDGSGAAAHRLLLTSSKTGSANQIVVTNNLAASGGGAERPVLSGNPSAIGAAVKTAYTGTSNPTSNEGTGGYTGLSDTTYTFTVTRGGNIGINNNITVDYTDSSGTNTGTLSINSNYVAGTYLEVAEGVQVKFGAGKLDNGDTFQIGATAAVVAADVQEATDANITLGTGPGAITITSAKNQLDNVIEGVTLDLQAADPAKQLTVSVGRNTEPAMNAVSQFVESFNTLMAFIDDQVKFDAESGVASLLQGNRSATSIQNDVRRVVTSMVPGVGGSMNRLSALGITVNDRGRLALNSARLSDALNGQLPGVGEGDLKRLFALDGQSDNPGVQFVLGSTRTRESSEPVQIEILQAAERATITATNALAASTVINSSNREFSLKIDGADTLTLSLTEGTYTRQQLADHVQSVINASPEIKGRSVRITVENDRLRVTSNAYGLASEVTIGSGSALASLGFAGGESDRGQDVAGRFIVGGVTETAVGTGRILSGDTKNAHTADLQVRVTLTSAQVQNGVDAEMVITRGIASKLDQTLGAMLDPITGRMKTIDDGFADRIASLEATIEKRNALIESRREALLRQFAALEGNISQLQSTSNFLAAQLTGLIAGGTFGKQP